MRLRQGEFERIRAAMEEAGADEPLTAREILQLLEEHGEDNAEEFESAHRIATVLGRRADAGDVEVIRGQPYRYRFVDSDPN